MKDEIINNEISSISIRFAPQINPTMQQKTLMEPDFGKEIMEVIQEDYNDKIEELLKGEHQSVLETYSITMEKFELEVDIRLVRGGKGKILTSVTIRRIRIFNKDQNQKRVKIKNSKWKPYFNIRESIQHSKQ